MKTYFGVKPPGAWLSPGEGVQIFEGKRVTALPQTVYPFWCEAKNLILRFKYVYIGLTLNRAYPNVIVLNTIRPYR